MRRTLIVAAVLTAGMLSGCGRSEYDEQVEKAIRTAKNPPAAEPENADAAKEAGKEGDPNAAPPAAAPPEAAPPMGQ